MNDNFTPPTAPVADMQPKRRASWLLTVGLVIAFGLLSLFLAWILVPVVAASIATAVGIDGAKTPPTLLALDLVLSSLAFFLGCYLAARWATGRAFVAAAGVGAIGWLVYFAEAGGLQGLLSSKFPLWYDFFPSHALAAVAAALLVRRQDQ